MHLFGWNNCSSNDYCGLGDLNSGFKMAFALWTGIASVAIAVMNGCIIFAILRSVRRSFLISKNEDETLNKTLNLFRDENDDNSSK